MDLEEEKVIVGDHIRWMLDADIYKAMSDYYLVLSKLNTVLCSCNDITGPIEIDKILNEYLEKGVSKDAVNEIRAEYKTITDKLKPQKMPDFMKALRK